MTSTHIAYDPLPEVPRPDCETCSAKHGHGAPPRYTKESLTELLNPACYRLEVFRRAFLAVVRQHMRALKAYRKDCKESRLERADEARRIMDDTKHHIEAFPDCRALALAIEEEERARYLGRIDEIARMRSEAIRTSRTEMLAQIELIRSVHPIDPVITLIDMLIMVADDEKLCVSDLDSHLVNLLLDAPALGALPGPDSGRGVRARLRFHQVVEVLCHMHLNVAIERLCATADGWEIGDLLVDDCRCSHLRAIPHIIRRGLAGEVRPE